MKTGWKYASDGPEKLSVPQKNFMFDLKQLNRYFIKIFSLRWPIYYFALVNISINQCNLECFLSVKFCINYNQHLLIEMFLEMPVDYFYKPKFQ